MEQRPHDTLLYRPASYIERLDLTKMFLNPQPLELELGAGDGSFLIQWAKLNPNRNFLGVERLLVREKRSAQPRQTHPLARWAEWPRCPGWRSDERYCHYV